MKVKFCKDCAYSQPDKHSTWTLRCVNPQVNASDEYALAYATFDGTSCVEQRRNTSWFAKCGQRGKQWTPK